MIEIQDLVKKYGKQQVLSNLSISFEPGTVTGIIGQNGTGKTTLIKCILGLTKFEKGNIKVNGISTLKDAGYRRYIGYMPQIGRYPETMRVEHLFSIIRDLHKGEQEDTELYDAFQLSKIGRKHLGELSGGTIQKVSAALAFLFNPPVLILDEPTAGLDPVAAEIIKDKINRIGKDRLLLITSHILNDLEEIASHVVFLQDGTVLFHESLEKLRSQSGNLSLGKTIASLMQTNFQTK